MSAVGARCGKCFLAKEKWSAIANTHMVWPETSVIDPGFLWWIFNDEEFWLKGGSGQPFVKTKASFQKQLCLPPLNEQRRIVERIEAMFEKIEKGVESLRAAKATLGLYRQSLLKSAFEGRLTADWRTQNADKLESPEVLLARIRAEREARYTAAVAAWQEALAQWRAGGEKGKRPKKSKRSADQTKVGQQKSDLLAELPSGWIYTDLANLGNLERGRSKHRPRNDKRLFGGPYPFIQTSEVKAAERYIRKYEATYSEIGLEQSRLWPAGTLCITIAANIAETAFLSFDACFPDSVVGFTTFGVVIIPKYVELFIKSARENIEAYAPATAQKNINLKTLETLIIPCCGQAEQAEIVRLLDTRLDAADALEAEIDAALTRATAMRQSILKKAFSGKLVPQDPQDEPATMMLERIRTERTKVTNQSRQRPARP
ncbi:MAG: restriction endonuclease subunit S [Cyanobacteria bacterium MAG CAR3_bin_5]|nr:restriction endonuclease subunit S [Cyanobacteria bacterium MAG CAR3_bin_5]